MSTIINDSNFNMAFKVTDLVPGVMLVRNASAGNELCLIIHATSPYKIAKRTAVEVLVMWPSGRTGKRRFIIDEPAIGWRLA